MRNFLVLCGLLGFPLVALGGEKIYDFDDGTFQGWGYYNNDGEKLVIGSGPDESIVGWAVTDAVVDAGGGEGFDVLQGTSVHGIGAIGSPQRIPNPRVLPQPYESRDVEGLTQRLQSPVFRLDGSGPISVDMIGGQAQGERSFDPANDTPPEFPDDHGFTMGADGWQGYALYDVADDAYVRWGFPTFNNDGKERDGREVWETVTIPTADLADFANDGRTYRLDIFDSYAGSWGWIGFDTVRLPKEQVEIVWGGGDGEWSDANWHDSRTPAELMTATELIGSKDGSNGIKSVNLGETITIGGGATVNYDGATIDSDFRIKQGSSLVIKEGATWTQNTLPEWSQNRWTQMDLSNLVLDGGTYRRTGAAPLDDPGDPLSGGTMMLGSWRGDDNFPPEPYDPTAIAIAAPQTIDISIINGGSLENEGQLWFGSGDHAAGLTVRVHIDDGKMDLTGGTQPPDGDFPLAADLVFVYDRDDDGTLKNENYVIDFTGPGSITVDSAGIAAPTEAENGDFEGLESIGYEELWNRGILRANGQSGLGGATFADFFSTSGASGSDDYMLVSLLTGGMLIGDCNGDGVLDAQDLACVSTIDERDAVLTALNTLPGDLDGNGDVAFPDFLVLSTNFNQDLPAYTDGNIDLAGKIDFADFLVLSTNFNKTPAGAAAAVPEPGTAILMLMAFMGLVATRRRRQSVL